MSASPNAQHRKKDRPPALDIPQDDTSDANVDPSVEPVSQQVITTLFLLLIPNTSFNQPSVHISPAQEEPSMDHDLSVSRSTSTTSSLDPYYFGIRSPSDSPVPPLPTGLIQLSSTPEQRQVQGPVTPARDPATIDRRGLVGVGELTTPRWTRTEHHNDLETTDDIEENGEFDIFVPDVTPDDDPDSPWTIEAVDSEASEKEEVCFLILLLMPLHQHNRSGVGY